MKNIIKKLEKIEAQLEATVYQRQETYDNRSDTWRESDKAAEHEEKTDLLNEVHEKITDALADLNDYLDL